MTPARLFAPALILAACHAPPRGAAAPHAPVAVAGVDDALCEATGKRVVTFDLNHDGKPDVWRLYDRDGHLTCERIDFDHDGRVDWITAYDREGRALYRKADLDYDGRWDVVLVLDPATGAVTRITRSIGWDGRDDVVERYDAHGHLISVARVPPATGS